MIEWLAAIAAWDLDTLTVVGIGPQHSVANQNKYETKSN